MRAQKECALALGCKYVYDEWGRINLHADHLEIGDKCVFETLPISGQIDTTLSPIARTSRTAIFAFLKHCELDFEGAEVGGIIDEMLAVAKRYIVMLDATGEFEPINTLADWSAVIDFLDANMAGVRVTLTLKEIQGECVR